MNNQQNFRSYQMFNSLKIFKNFTGPALIAVFFLKTEAAILHKYVCIIIIIITLE